MDGQPTIGPCGWMELLRHNASGAVARLRFRIQGSSNLRHTVAQ